MNWEPAIFEITRDGYVMSTDPARVDFDLVHGFLARDSYWAQGMTAVRLKRALSHSLPVGVYAPDGSMAAFARLVTDYAVFGYLRDVFTVEDHRGRGLASWIATEIRKHPELSTVSRLDAGDPRRPWRLRKGRLSRSTASRILHDGAETRRGLNNPPYGSPRPSS